MAESPRRRRVRSDGDSEASYTESDVETEDVNDAENSIKGTPEKLSRRRRRRVKSVDGLEDRSFSETGSEQEDEVNLVIKQQNAVSKVGDGSEYESAEEEEEAKATDKTCEESPSKDQESLSELVDEEGGEEGIAETEDVEGDFLSGDHPDEGSEEGEYVEEERQQGDGEECSPTNAVLEKELDFDEDRRNPQYIPKKGIFYEHDDRNNEDAKEKEEPARDRKKKLWLDEGRWGHDRFRLEEQYPKSRHELIETYGYDIRNEDGPPRARRRRRYGRGPTKYERNWEDVSAYSREKFRSQRGFSRGRRARGRFRGAPRFRGRGRREYNSQGSDGKKDEIENGKEEEEDPVINENKESENNDNVPIINNKEFPALPTKEIIPEPEPVIEKRPFFQKSSSEAPENKSVRTLTFENSNFSGRNSLERDVPPRRGKTAPFGNHYSERGTRKPVPRGLRGTGRGDHRRGRGGSRHISPRFLENKVNSLNTEMEQLTIEDSADVTNNGVQSDTVRQLENSGITSNIGSDGEMSNLTLKGVGDSSGRPKRYSSLRQRSLPETSSYQTTQQAVPTQHASYYETAGYQPALYAPTDSGVPTPSTQSQSATSPPLINPSAYQTFAPTPYTDSYGLRMPVTTPPPRLFPQATVPAGQPILTPPPPPPCIPPNPSIMNFAPPPPPAGYHSFTYPPYHAQPPPPPPAAPNEMYQTGITYYYPQTQPPSIRPTVQKRPKAAIPIMPPPEHENKRNENKETSQASNSNSRNSPSEAVNGEVPSLRTEPSSQSQQLPSVGVES